MRSPLPRSGSLTALVAGGLLVAGLAAVPAASATTATAATTTGPTSTLTRFAGAAWSTGTASGTATKQGALYLRTPTSRSTSGGRSLESATWTSPWTTPGHSFTELVPSWQASTPAGSVVKVAVRARTTTGRVSSFDDVATWSLGDAGVKRSSASAQPDDYGRVATDTFAAAPGIRFGSWQLRITLTRTTGGAGPVVRGVGAVASAPVSALPATSRPLYGARSLAVPAYSQMTHRGQYPQYGNGGEAWCSPTSLSMLLGYYRALPSAASYAWVSRAYSDRWVDHVARLTYDHAYRGTGNWPFNTAVGAHYAGDGFVTRLSSLRDAERFIHVGIPVAISISFSRGQLSGAPISATNGHLVVVSGFTAAGDVIVNDPAAPGNASVRRTYDRGQLERAWMRSSHGTTYVVRDAAHPLPARAGAHRW